MSAPILDAGVSPRRVRSGLEVPADVSAMADEVIE
jgi:hypothetical protein